jgi:hypothetical protein
VEEAIRKKERWETRLVRRKDVDTVAGAFGEGNTFVREEVIPTSVLVGAEAERERLEWLLKQHRELEGLTGAIGKDYREMTASAAADGGKGVDFRENKRFSSKMKAHDFENETVVADAIRIFFRRAPGADVAFGETASTVAKRMHRAQMPSGYFRVAKLLKAKWEDRLASGAEQYSFGKVMMDRCQEWAKLKADQGRIGESLSMILQECGYQPNEADLLPVGDEHDITTGYAGGSSSSNTVAASATKSLILEEGDEF